VLEGSVGATKLRIIDELNIVISGTLILYIYTRRYYDVEGTVGATK
jgi:hypothetical protein